MGGRARGAAVYLNFLALILSAIAFGLVRLVGWPDSIAWILLALLAVWCDFSLFWSALADLRQEIMKREYSPRKREVPVARREWRVDGYKLAGALAGMQVVFGALLGAGAGWLVAGMEGALFGATRIGLAYLLPMLPFGWWLANRYAEMRRVLAELHEEVA